MKYKDPFLGEIELKKLVDKINEVSKNLK